MTYAQAIDYLYTRLPMFQRSGPAAYKANLDNSHRLDRALGHPHRAFRSLHIAGTNGKGSTAHMLAAILQSAGYRCGLFTSPHLVDFRERIRIDGLMIPEKAVCRFVEANKELVEQIEPSFFELTTLMAFRHFADEQVDIAVIETGMGGRLDTTNIITPLLTLITNIGLDHTQFLGNTIEEIAHEKAGIIKPGVPLVAGEQQAGTETVFREVCQNLNAPFIPAWEKVQANWYEKYKTADITTEVRHFRNVELDLGGSYQLLILPGAITAIAELNKQGYGITESHIREGLAHVRGLTGMRGRYEHLQQKPEVICDVAHNAEGLRHVLSQLAETGKKLYIVFGTVADKAPHPLLELLPMNARIIYTQADLPRALDAQKLADMGQQAGRPGPYFSRVPEAIRHALGTMQDGGLLFIGGSTFVAAEAITFFEDFVWE